MFWCFGGCLGQAVSGVFEMIGINDVVGIESITIQTTIIDNTILIQYSIDNCPISTILETYGKLMFFVDNAKYVPVIIPVHENNITSKNRFNLFPSPFIIILQYNIISILHNITTNININ